MGPDSERVAVDEDPRRPRAQAVAVDAASTDQPAHPVEAGRAEGDRRPRPQAPPAGLLLPAVPLAAGPLHADRVADPGAAQRPEDSGRRGREGADRAGSVLARPQVR